MIDFEDIKKYLPQYLSDYANANLFSELETFPENIDGRLYTSFLKNNPIVYQCDGISGLIHYELPDSRISEVNGVILSNTCDISQQNDRYLPSKLVHAPIINLQKYHKMLRQKFVGTGQKSEDVINHHIQTIKKQYVSHIFFLPKGEGLVEDSIIFFDRLSSLPSNYVKEDTIISRRLFTLSDFGFYLFLFKLSIHYTRVRENVSRDPSMAS